MMHVEMNPKSTKKANTKQNAPITGNLLSMNSCTASVHVEVGTPLFSSEKVQKRDGSHIPAQVKKSSIVPKILSPSSNSIYQSDSHTLAVVALKVAEQSQNFSSPPDLVWTLLPVPSQSSLSASQGHARVQTQSFASSYTSSIFSSLPPAHYSATQDLAFSLPQNMAEPMARNMMKAITRTNPQITAKHLFLQHISKIPKIMNTPINAAIPQPANKISLSFSID